MVNYDTLRFLHRHGDDWVELEREGPHHDPAAHDPERTWATHRRLLRCRQCDEEIMVETPDDTGRPG